MIISASFDLMEIHFHVNSSYLVKIRAYQNKIRTNMSQPKPNGASLNKAGPNNVILGQLGQSRSIIYLISVAAV